MTDGWKAAKRKIVSGSGAGYKTKCSNKTCTIRKQTHTLQLNNERRDDEDTI